jgi:tRNA pseudouridine13 synthase
LQAQAASEKMNSNVASQIIDVTVETTEKEESIAVAPKVLQRHYSTIGIEDVFLEGPPHSLPSEYLPHNNTLTKETFTSWEIVGTIKNSPEDFCVKEVFQRSRRIPGLSDEALQKLRVADILEPGQLPEQRLEIQQPAEPRKDATKSETVEPEEDKTVDVPLPAAVIKSYIAKLEVKEENSETTVDRIVKSLDILHVLASKRVQQVAAKQDSNETSSVDGDTIWIPPLVMEDTGGDYSATLRQARGEFYRAFRAEYPFLSTATTAKDGVEHWISVKIDASYDELIPYLLDPENDIRSLLAFQKQGFQETPKGHEAGRNNRGNRRDMGSDDSPKVILKLKPSATKDERKEIHRILSSGCKSFSTSTISDFALEDGKNTTVIYIGWFAGSRKRKREKTSKDGESSPADEYSHVLTVFKKRQKEHLTAIQKLTQIMKCRQSDIGIAGIKDLQAITCQFLTFRNMKIRRIQNANKQLEKYGMELGNFYRVNWVLNNGDLDGNEFVLVIRNLRRIRVEWGGSGELSPTESMVECEESHIRQMVERLRRSGYINFFGEQRVGSAGTTDDVGVRSFDIGRAMLQQNFAQAVDLLMTGRSGDDSRESDAAKRVRQKWKDSGGDPAETLKAFQGADNFMSRERIVLKGLNRYGKDRPLEALRCLSHSMRTFWINAYQSFVWNQVASARIQKYGKTVVKGDLYQDEENNDIKVVESDENSMPFSRVVLPLPGHNIQYPENEIGNLYKSLLERDSVKFEKTAPVESRAKGTYRALVVQPLEMKSEMILPDAVKLSFQLPKGSYATMCLREFMTTTGTR